MVLVEEARRAVSAVLSVRTASLAGTDPAGPTSAALVPSITLKSPDPEVEGVPGLLDVPFRPVSRSVRSRPLRSVRVGVPLPRLFGVPGVRVSGVPGAPGAPGVVGVVGLLNVPSLANMLNPLRDFRLVSGFDDGIIFLCPGGLAFARLS